MRKYIYIIILLLFNISCSDDESFVVEMSIDGFKFTPVMGGALLQYSLPDDDEIIAIQIRYEDVYGNPIIKSGSNSSNSLKLTGFNEAVTDIPAQISFLRKDHQESAPIDVHFSTLDSGPVTFLKNAEVKSGWDGCTLTYENPEGTEGMAHVFYLGINPLTQESDTIFLESFPLNVGKDTRSYTPKQKNVYNTIIVRVEDYRGYMVQERQWEKIQAFPVERLDPSKFSIVYDNSLEVPEEKIGLKYLTDGDVKGTAWFQEQNRYGYYTFISKENGAGDNSKPMYIDLKKVRPAAELRFYAYRHVGNNKIAWGENGTSPYVGPKYFKNSLANKLPSSVTVYGCRDYKEGQSLETLRWEELGSFNDDSDASNRDRWTFGAATCGGTTFGRNTYNTLEKMEKAKPIYKSIPIDINIQGEGFRWLKIVYNHVFNLENDMSNMSNKETQYLSFHELEIYSDKE